jgi:hypothetical protein
MKRDAAITASLDDSVRVAVGLPVSAEGDYFVGDGSKDAGEEFLAHNIPPTAQPGLPGNQRTVPAA